MVARIYFDQPCNVDGCDRPAVTRCMCGMHYQRWKKYGHADGGRAARVKDGRVVGRDGYVSIWEPSHPLARKDGYVSEHRKVIHDAGISVPSGYHVHHINGVKHDNRIENLEVISAAAHGSKHAESGHIIANQFGVWTVGSGPCRLCEQPARSRGLCNGHYLRWRRGRLHIEGMLR